MNAVVTAGGRPALDEPLYEQTQGGYKAMLEIHGKTMIQWVLDALSQTHSVDRVVVTGLPPFTDLTCEHPLTLIEDQGNLLANARAGVLEAARQAPDSEFTLLLTSDVPAITPPMIDWVAEQILAGVWDFVYPVISRTVMEERFPGSHRTYLRLKDVEVCGADVMGVRSGIAAGDNPLWQRVIDTRKNPIRQAALFGYDTLFMILLRQLSLEEAGKSISQRLGIHARPVLCPYAELGMDIDKPNQLKLVESTWVRQLAI